jgi:glycosyltransferase involved in cell wall biosynthesis
MRIALFSVHRYPASGGMGTGLHPTTLATGGSCIVHDWLARGLAELGHEVWYLLPGGAAAPLPTGVLLASEPLPEVDILHHYNSRWVQDAPLVWRKAIREKPWVTTCHAAPTGLGQAGETLPGHWIFVSRTLAQCYGTGRYVINGINPDEYVYSETKDEYFLFISNMGSMTQVIHKGLPVALAMARTLGFNLVVAGACREYKVVEAVATMCRQAGASYVGDVRGVRKAELFAGAKALLFPTQLPEAFGLVMAEALMSGTPVICSDRGACPEIISAAEGFVCQDWQDYIAAIDRVDTISPQTCRDKALREFHYLRMAADYVKEYEHEIHLAGAGV